MLAFVTASVLGFVCVALFVGTRLLLLGRRTGGAAELLMAGAVLMVGGIGYPAAMLSGYGVKPVGEMLLPAYGVSTVANAIGAGCMAFFTWKVFRAGERWALALAAGIGVAAVVSQAGLAHAMWTAPAALDSHLAGRGWFAAGLLSSMAAFGWSGSEAWMRYRLSLRRQALGLVDPLVTNRFLLWALVGAGSCLGGALNLVAHLEARPIFDNVPVLLMTGAIGFAMSASLLLTFSPPARFASWVRRRAAA